MATDGAALDRDPTRRARLKPARAQFRSDA
jgi:hypothetical protein